MQRMRNILITSIPRHSNHFCAKHSCAISPFYSPVLKSQLSIKRTNLNDQLPTKFEATPITLALRPFAGLFNPYAKGCSVLCNHPAPTAVRDVINQLKSTLATEGKNILHPKERLDNISPYHETDNIPEDLFRRYTDTDSRPLTPSPTVTSVRTRTSAGSFLNNRRCITPELGKNEIIKRKKIILDLRKSHSQETLYWKPSSDVSQGATITSDGGDNKPKSAGANEERKPKRQKSEEQRPKSSLAVANVAASPDDETINDAKKPTSQTCINEHDLNDDDVRRGKKRKKIKSTTATTTFRLSEDPETQVATLGPDSMNPSTRPSLIPNCASLLPNKEKRDSEPVLLKGSYLTDEAFQALKTELDVDVIENTFGRYVRMKYGNGKLNRALREAIKYIPPKPKPVPKLTEEMEKLTFVPQSKMPRKFSKSATRFEVPLNLKSLETMTVLQYLSKYVWVSRQRKQLYKRVFLKYLTQQPMLIDVPNPVVSNQVANNDEQPLQPVTEYIERTMSLKHLPKALEDVLEFHGNEKNISEVLRLLEYDTLKIKELDFRAWCGIVSFAERLALDSTTNTDSCDELEKVDFTSMEQRLEYFTTPPELREVFSIIKRSHNLPY